MSDEYAGTLMNCSPTEAFSVVVILSIATSTAIANITSRLFKIKTKQA